MTDINRRIYFSVEENNIESTFSRLKQLSNESAQELIKNANQYSKTGKDVLSYLKEEIELREKKRKLEIEERKSDIGDIYERQLAGAKTQSQREKAVEGYKGRMKEVSLQEREMEKQTVLLRQIIETLQHTAREEIRENRKEVEKQVHLYRQGKLKDLTPEQEAKVKMQSEMLGFTEERKDKSVFAPVFWGTMLANMIPKTFEKIGAMVRADSSERAANTMLRVIPFGIGDLVADIRERALDAQEMVETARFKFQATTGNIREQAGRRGVGYGLVPSDIFGLGMEASRARGMGRGNIESGEDMAALQKAYNLEYSQSLKLMRTERFGGGGAMKDVGLIINTLKNQGLWNEDTQTKIPEYLEMLVSLQEEQIKKGGTIDNVRNMANLSAMAKLGDKYFRDTTYVTGISNAIANPQNEFQQARSLAVLAGIKPGSDLWELQLMQEKGLGQEGYMSGVVQQIRKRYGTGNLGEMAMYETLKGGGQNISRADARRIYQESLKDPRLWENVTDEQSLANVLTKFGVDTRALGKARTSELSKDIALRTTEYAEDALKATAHLVEDAGKKLAEMLKEAGGYFLDTFKSGIPSVIEEAKKNMGKDPSGFTSLMTLTANPFYLYFKNKQGNPTYPE